MKKFVFTFFLFSLMVFSAQAQKAACCKSGGKSASAVSCHAKAPSAASAETSAAAAKVAAMDQTIETRTDPITGTVTYVRKETAVADGSVTFVSLDFDPVTNSFVNVSPAMTEGNHCMPKATSASGKACCAKGSSAGKACCASKSGAAASAAPKPEKIKS